MLSGVQYAEAGETSCCGGAGAFSLSHYELALKIEFSRAVVLHTVELLDIAPAVSIIQT